MLDYDQNLRIEYAGIFFYDDDSIRSKEEHPLKKTYYPLHCTFKYHPTSEDIELLNQLIGKTIDVYLVGYGYNDDNSGFEIEFQLETGENIDNYYINYDENNIPKKKHITVSLSETGSAVNTNNIKFRKFNSKIGPFKGVFGYKFRGIKNICYMPIDPAYGYDKAKVKKKKK